MVLSTGTRLGPYEILSALGAGGMGEVYRARDTRLNRDVAIKILPDAFAADADRVARFQREAQVLASLNHPNIAHIYGLEHAEGHQALILELVEGPTLADVIAGTATQAPAARASSESSSSAARASGGGAPRALEIDEVLPIARQIAEALEAAHELGVIHRDLKPANIKLTADGKVKVLDFGLAKIAEDVGRVLPSGPAGSAGSKEQDPAYVLSQSPTITSPALATRAGIILGTAAYMSPEQAKGKPVDKRSDIWAFGCVLFEMLTGKRAFQGDDVSDTMANILKSEPDWKELPADLPPTVRTLVQRCLAKDRVQRIGDMSTARFLLTELGNPEFVSALAVSSLSATPRQPLWKRVATYTTAWLVGAATVGTAVWFAVHASLPTPHISRLQITPSSAAALTIDGVIKDLAITPDGSRIVYGGANGTTLFVRALDQIDGTPLTGLGAPRGPFVSPDGQWIGFVDGTTTLKKVAITGGPAVTLGILDGPIRGASWSLDGTIVYATGNATTGLQRIPAGGGEATVLTHPNRARGELDHLWPEVLPGGNAVLFTVTSVSGGLDQAQIVVLDLRTGTQTVLIRGGSDAQYVSSGHLIYAAAGSLRAVGFDLTHLAVVGTPVPVVSQVAITPQGGADVAIGTDGTLAYAAGVGATRSLVWVDRQGHETPISLPSRAYVYPRLAPDGARLAVSANDQESDIWLVDTARPALTRVTFDPGLDLYPVWAPEGRRLFFSSNRAGVGNLFVQAADGTGEPKRLTESPNTQYPTSISPDGTRLIFTETTPKTGEDVMQLRLDKAPPMTAEPLVQTPFTERNGEVSPSGRWLAYQANDSGAFEIYVRPFPDVNSGHWQVSTGGGTRPLWTRNGQELVYIAPSGELMRVGVENGPSWSATPPTKVLDGKYFMSGGTPGRTYDVSRDGQRFLMVKQGGGPESSGAPTGIVVVQNWFEELKRLVPVK